MGDGGAPGAVARCRSRRAGVLLRSLPGDGDGTIAHGRNGWYEEGEPPDVELRFDEASPDALASLLIAALMAPRALALLRRSLAILMEQAPESVDVGELRTHMMGTDGVLDVHDLHVAPVSSRLVTVTAHVTVTHEADGPCRDRIVHELGECASHHFPISHSTFQLECPQHREHEHLEHELAQPLRLTGVQRVCRLMP